MLEQLRERSGMQYLLVMLVLAALALQLAIPLGLLDSSGLPQPAVTQGHALQQSADTTVRQSKLASRRHAASDCHCPLSGRNRTVGARCKCFASPTAFWSSPRLELASAPVAAAVMMILVPVMTVQPTATPPVAVPGRGLAAPPPPSQAPPSSPSEGITA